MYFFAHFFSQNLGIVSVEGRGYGRAGKCPQYPIVRVIISRQFDQSWHVLFSLKNLNGLIFPVFHIPDFGACRHVF